MLLDVAPAKAINRAIGAIAVGDGTFRFSSCNTALAGPSVNFFLAGTTYAIPASIYVLNNGGKCSSGFAGVPGVKLAILGDVWIKAVYTIFDKTNSQVGFAKSINVK